MPNRVAVPLAALLQRALVLTFATGAAAAAPAPTKSCKNVGGRAGGVDQIRVTKSFSCRATRADIRGWLNLIQESGPRPWTCTYRGATVSRWRCTLRTSFGGTRSLRRYRLTFRLLDA